MYQDHTVGVVIPAYNEAGFVGDVIETVPDYVDRIYPVDDCSTDDTWAEIRAAATRVDGSLPSVSADGGTRTSSEGVHRVDGDGHSSDASSLEDRSTGGRSIDDRAVTDSAPGDPGVQAETEAAVAGLLDDLDAPSGERASEDGADGRGSRDEAIDEDGFDRRVVPLRHEENRGVGGAIKTGYQRARADRVDVTVVMGGDGQMNPDWMADLVEPVVDGRAEYAKANRLLLSEHHETMPRHRFVGNHLLTILTKIATGYWSVGDPQHGYTAISLEALETAGVDEMYEFFGYCNDLLIRLSAANLRVADVPCPLTYADEESHIDYGSYVPRVSGMLLRSFLRRLWVDRGSAAGRGRLALFLGGAIATVGGLAGIVAAGVAGGSSSSADVPDPASDLETVTSVSADDETVAAAGDADEEVAPERTESGAAGVRRAVAVALAGVASLLGAMLLDAVTNSTSNYTERVPEDAEPRVGNSGADESSANDGA